MAASLIFSSPAGSTALVPDRNKVAIFSVAEFSSVRIYAFVRPSTPQLTVYLINPDLHDHVGTDPAAGALDSFVLNALQGKTGWRDHCKLLFSYALFGLSPDRKNRSAVAAIALGARRTAEWSRPSSELYSALGRIPASA
jgi:hypothetical protein